MSYATQLELHYFLADESHTMDALVRNKCETELLAIFQEVSVSLGVSIAIESFAHQEGGLKDVWKFLKANDSQLTLLLAILVLVLSRYPTSDSEMEVLDKEVAKLTIEEKRLSIEEKRLAIEKLKKEMKDDVINQETIEDAAKAINQNLKVLTRKSNFYKGLSNYEKVTGVSYAPLNEMNKPIQEERFVPKSDFGRFVLFSNELPVETIEDAQIEIISPVLREGNYRWKGIFRDEPISFSMTDAEFKSAVLREEVSFQHGSLIDCVLNVYRKFDEVGDVVVTGHSVVTVVKKTDGVVSVETPQGRRHKAHKKFIENQKDLF